MMPIINIAPVDGRVIVIYGAGHHGRIATEMLESLGTMAAFCVARDGDMLAYCGGELPVYRPHILEKDKHFVIVASKNFANEMSEYLIELGYLEGADFIVWGAYEFEYIKDDNNINTFEEYIHARNALMADPRLYSTLQDGFLRLRITHKCNAKCRFCGLTHVSRHHKKSVDNIVLYDYLKPLYSQIKTLLLTGGDPLVHDESFAFCQFISKNYPHITIFLETNGIAFTRKWQELASENLMKVHISLNASNEAVFRKGCWEGDAGSKAFYRIRKNIEDYMIHLKEKGLEVFSPDVSMVINKDTAGDVREFVKYALSMGLNYCVFFFDRTEIDIDKDYFSQPEIFRPALYEMMKLERVLAEKFFLRYTLYIPLKEVALMQDKVEEISIDDLMGEYSDIVALASKRSMKLEYEVGQAARQRVGKRGFRYEESLSATLRQEHPKSVSVCGSPFRLLDVFPDGEYECCGWILPPRFKIAAYVTNNEFDWESAYNNIEMRFTRQKMLEGCYSFCMKCCPRNPTHLDVCDLHRHRVDRVGE